MTLSPQFHSQNSRNACPMDSLACVYPCCKLRHARQDIGMSDKAMTWLLGVNRSTWWRYQSGQQRPPRAVCGFLAVLSGVLPWKDWRGFVVNPGNEKLFLPGYRDGVSANDVLGYWWVLQEVRALREALAAFSVKIPEPASPADDADGINL